MDVGGGPVIGETTPNRRMTVPEEELIAIAMISVPSGEKESLLKPVLSPSIVLNNSPSDTLQMRTAPKLSTDASRSPTGEKATS